MLLGLAAVAVFGLDALPRIGLYVVGLTTGARVDNQLVMPFFLGIVGVVLVVYGVRLIIDPAYRERVDVTGVVPPPTRSTTSGSEVPRRGPPETTRGSGSGGWWS